MKKIKLLFAAMLSMMAWNGVMAQTAAEYEAALDAITDGAQYRISTDVDGTKYYVTAGGTLTTDKAKGDAFAFKKVNEGGEYVIDAEAGTKAVGIQLTSSAGTRFTNAALSNSKAVLETSNFKTTTNNRANWESQVFFLKDDKYAIRSCNTAYAESSWQDAGRTFWTYTIDPVDPEYSYDPAYVWELEEYTESAEQKEALAKVQAWPAYVQSAAGLVKDAGKFYSNAKEPSEGSYEALLDGEYTTFFHSSWSVNVDETHYLQVELTESIQKFEFYFKKRSQNNNNRPTTIVISASNDAEGDFTDVTTLDSGFPTDAAVLDYFSNEVDLGAAYKFVRFAVTATSTNSKYFTFSEFYLFPEAAAQLAPLYNAYSSALAGDLTAEDINQISAADQALKSAISTIKVTYQLVESDGTVVATKEVVQKPYSDIDIPSSVLPNTKFYDYTTEGTIGEEDCTITVTRTLKAGYVGALADLSNDKAYTITCDRGAMLTNGTTIASTSNSTYASAEPGQFAIINYEDNYYLYSVADSKFVANNGSLVEKPSNGVLDALQMTPKAVPYFMFYFIVNEGGTQYGVNTNGTGNLGGIVINDWMNADAGNQYYMVEAADFDATDALAALDAQFHPAYTLTYVVKDTKGNPIYYADPVPTELGATITTLPDTYKRAYYTYDEINVEVADVNTEAVFTATWNGPFEISESFDNAHWYDMAMRSTWYVTSDVKDGDGAYKTQNANTMGLVEDSYQWAFMGDGYNGFKIINKAEGDSKSFGWTDATATNAGIPTIMDDSEGYHAWKIVASTNTSVPANSFCLNVPGTNLYINQYGGAGGSVKFWNSANNVGDPGSAFTVFDVPTNFASYVADEIAPYFETTAKYFVLSEDAKTAVGYDESKKTECSFDDYKAMKEALTDALADADSYVWPETGYYILKNKNYTENNYMGIDPSDANMYGNYAAATAAKNIVKLTKTGDATYTIGLMGKFAPATVGRSAQVTASDEAGTYTVTIPTVGYAAFSPTPTEQYSYLHRDSSGKIVGWEAVSAGSQWAVEDATSIELTIGEAGYATAYLPFAVELPAEGVTAYTAEFEESWLKLNAVSSIAAKEPVVLKGTTGTYSFTIAAEDGTPTDGNVLKGTLESIDATGKYVLAQPEGEAVGFYLADKGTIAANKAYLEIADADVKGFTFVFGGDATGISETVNANALTGKWYNVAGQRVNKAQKGIYIVNGKKVVK